VSYTYSYLTTTGKKDGSKRSLEKRGLMPADSAVALVGSADGTVSVWPIHLPGIVYGGSEVGAKGGGNIVTSVAQTIGSANASGTSEDGILRKRGSAVSGAGISSVGRRFDPLKKIKSLRLLRGMDGGISTDIFVDDADGPVQWLHGHDSAVSAVDADLDLGIVVSGSESGVCLVHDIHRGTFLVSLIVKDENVKQTAADVSSSPKHTKGIRIVRIIPNTSRVIVVTDAYVHTFSSSTGELIMAVAVAEDPFLRPHCVAVSPDSRFLLVASGDMVTVQVAHDLKVVQILCRYASPESLAELRTAGALHVRGHDGAECLPDGTVCIDKRITAAQLSPNGDVAFVGTEGGELLAFLVQLNWDRTIL
jgi:WD40 repeat protein